MNYAFDRMTGHEDGAILIYGLENVAGAGKTAIAHSSVGRCYILCSSPSFDRENPERNRLQFLTFAQDLAARDPLAGYVPTAATLSRANVTLLRLSSLDSLQFSF